MKKHLVAAGIVAATATAGVAGLSSAYAETASTTNHDPMSSLVQAVATKFNLKTADVQAVFDAQRTQMHQQREQAVKDQIAGLVKDGKLTQTQADKLNAKRTELEAERDSNRAAMQGKTAAERRAAVQEHKTELDTWLKDNGISTDYAYLLMGGHGRGHGGPGGPGGPSDTQ